MCSSDSFKNVIVEVNCNSVTDFMVWVQTIQHRHVDIGGGYRDLVAWVWSLWAMGGNLSNAVVNECMNEC